MEEINYTKQIGKGSFGRIFLMKDTKTGENFAMKRILLSKMISTYEIDIYRKIPYVQFLIITFW